MMYHYSTSESCPPLYPAKIIDSMLTYGDEEDDWIDVGQNICLHPEWGAATAADEWCRDGRLLPYHIEIKWISVIEHACYHLDTDLDSDSMEKAFGVKDKEGKPIYRFIVVGMAPYGGVAVWLNGYKKSCVLDWHKAQMMDATGVDVNKIMANSTLDVFCEETIAADEFVASNLSQHGLPDHHLFDRMMQQFTYRFLPILKKWDKDQEEWMEYEEDETKPSLDFVEVKCHDGTFDRLRDGSLLNYHEAGKPSRVCVGWHVGKREYSAYFFFSHDEMVPVFRGCYGAHPETKTDFLLQIDPKSNKYEPALFRYGMKEPLAIPENACQVLVFRNKFECFRSPNYSQPKGAWR